MLLKKKRAEFAGFKRALRKGENHHLLASHNTFQCDICGRLLLNAAGLRMHMRMHFRQERRRQQLVNPAAVPLHDFMRCNCNNCAMLRRQIRNAPLIQRNNIQPNRGIPTVHKCDICDKICKSKGGLTLHRKVHFRN